MSGKSTSHKTLMRAELLEGLQGSERNIGRQRLHGDVGYTNVTPLTLEGLGLNTLDSIPEKSPSQLRVSLYTVQYW